jgi:hypothetical protein
MDVIQVELHATNVYVLSTFSPSYCLKHLSVVQSTQMCDKALYRTP